MKTITIDITDNVFNAFKKFLNSLPRDSFTVYYDEDDKLSNSEQKEIDELRAKTDNGDYSQFVEWDNVSKEL